MGVAGLQEELGLELRAQHTGLLCIEQLGMGDVRLGVLTVLVVTTEKPLQLTP